MYIGGQVQPGPGDSAVLNCDWVLSGEAVDAVGAGKSGDASLEYSSQGWATSWFQLCLDVDGDDAPSVSCGVSSSWGVYWVLLWEGGSPCCDLLKEEGSLIYPIKVAFHRR